MSVTQTFSKGSYILAVDDIPDNLLLVQLALEQEGYRVVLAHNGETALKQIKQFPPSLILLDVMMPGMDGYEVTRRIRQDKNIPFIPILLLTAREESSLVQGLDAGADEFVRKPFQIDELQARVRSMLRLKETIDQRENFVSCLTHDLRTPLVAANRMLDLIEQKVFGNITCEQQEAIANIISSNDNMLEMLNTLLETHHYELGQKTLNWISVDLQQLISEVVSELEPLAREKGLELLYDAVTNVAEVKGDRLELRRVITNLIGNAIKFTDTGKVQVSVSEHESKILVQVADSGIGISPEDQKAVFQRYHQGNHRRAGKGLGLYLCQQIINAHQGELKVQSQLGQGTTFTFSLPQA
ncbi:hybrid sensor histidine kinase/response regulator [Pleurocapsa sp. CCALA 161]|uniref:hybrid sensor histidine kinase/response regulator n=1 Tax=Pleurocapsa sp. CCALA 161 TaxID=2107688 RepID=UPI000D07811A|nr:HAMP domain-containing sensor histidine kinase [Pleurocapsa sp. CCALA 161]PSB09220.1 hybrid sensor histidine kinase/response regulator [Pleurocapsa sp. CCALA 161]